MPVTRVTELWSGQNFSGGVPQRLYMFREFDTALDVDAHLATLPTEIPLYWGGLPVDFSGRTISDLGGKVWSVVVPYSARAGTPIAGGAGTAERPVTQHGGENGRDEPVMFNVAYDVNGTTATVRQSISTIQSAATSDRAARNFGRAIGVNGDEVNGCEVVTGEPSFSVTAQIPNAAFTGAYATALANLLRHPTYRRACVNAEPFFGFAAGEVVIRSAHVGELGGDGYRPGRFEFAISRTIPELIINDVPELKLLNVKGWSHVWVTYEKTTQNMGVGLFRDRTIPFEAYEEQVYPDGDFTALKLETYRVQP